MQKNFWLTPAELILLYFIVINLAGFIVIGVDKYKAKHDRWRIPEKRLMLVAALGGSPGVLAGMYSFRHKTRHRLFTIGVPAILIVELALVLFLYFRFFR